MKVLGKGLELYRFYERGLREKKGGIIKGKFSKIGVYRTTIEKNLLTKGEDSG